MGDLSLARLLAPLALIAALVGVVVVVLLSSGSPPSPAPLTPAVTTTAVTRPAKTHARAYVVKPGDSLTAIATRTGVSVETLEALNPDVDPQALRVGERLKLTR